MNVPDGTLPGIQTTMSYSIVTPSTPNDNLGDGLTWFLTEVKDGIANNVPGRPRIPGAGSRTAMRAVTVSPCASTIRSGHRRRSRR